MKNFKHILGTLLVTAVVFTSCNKNNDDDTDIIIRASADEYNNLQDAALEGLTQNFQFNTEDGWISLTSENGVSISLDANCLTLNGNAITGQVDLEFVELFDKGNMLVTNKPTMGIMPTGDKAMLLSGGEFFINATQNGANLDINCSMQLEIPANLTGAAADSDMILWEGNIDNNGDLTWEEEETEDATGHRGVFAEGNEYYAFLNDFGWTNVDKFYSDPRDKTTLLVGVPEGYDAENCSLFLSYDGEDSGLANLDTYDSATGLFSEHYGQIPVGLECHLIFVTEASGNWKYAIQTLTITEGAVYTITDSETAIVTQAQLTTIINALP